jgi:hypothetical protein
MSSTLRTTLALVCVLLFVASAPSSPSGGDGEYTVVYVDDDAPPGGDGQSWETAFRSLQDALAFAGRNHGPYELHIAQGVYRPDQGTEQTPGDREASFRPPDDGDVRLYGGYAGLGAQDPDERDIELYPTVLSGDLNGDDGPEFTNYGDNSYHVFTGGNDYAELDGLLIRAGNANGSEDDADGGGIYNAARLTIRRSIFIANRADEEGGAVFSVLSQGGVFACRFERNEAELGGAICRLGLETPVTSCVFIDNRARIGGGVFNILADPILTACTFENNEAEFGGGMANSSYERADRTSSNPALIACIFRNNHADIGGGFFDDSIPAHIFLEPITDCRFENNTAVIGGGVYLFDSNPRFTECTIDGNEAAFGGGVYADHAAPQFAHCTVSNNTAELEGGGFVITGVPLFGDDPALLQSTRVTGNSAVLNGGGLLIGANARFVACRIDANSAHYGGGLYTTDGVSDLTDTVITDNHADMFGGGIRHRGNDLSIIQCLIARNDAFGLSALSSNEFCTIVDTAIVENVAEAGDGGAVGFPPYGGASLSNCIVWANVPGSLSGTADVRSSCIEGGWKGEGNIDADPLFVDPDQDDYRLSPGSPCIDAGDNFAVPDEITLDLAGLPRFIDDPDTPDTGLGDPPIVDMGAYEFPGSASLGDLNGDGVVDVLDLLILLSAWGDCPDPPDPCPADLNGDGSVSVLDLLTLLELWK